MKRFSVRYVERVCFIYNVEADTEEEAEAKAEARISAGDGPDEEWPMDNESGPEAFAQDGILEDRSNGSSAKPGP